MYIYIYICVEDDDLNFHIEFITRCGDCRADNYHITNSDFQKARTHMTEYVFAYRLVH